MSLLEAGNIPERSGARRKSELDEKLFWMILNLVLSLALAAILWSPGVIFYAALGLVPVLFAAIVMITLKPEA